MNKQRRKDLDQIRERLDEIQSVIADFLQEPLIQNLSELAEDFGALRDEETESYENLPESLQDGERGEAMQEAINNMDEGLDQLGSLQSAITDLENDYEGWIEEAQSSIDQASE